VSYIDDHHRRYGAFFKEEPWWEMHCALYDGPGSEWEGASLALDQMVYALAKARGLDTKQTCPRCQLVVDQAQSVGEWRSCDHCEHAEEIEHEVRVAADRLRKLEEEIRYLAMPPDARRSYDEENRKAVHLALSGLMARDVQ
jgi:hypothetical protein